MERRFHAPTDRGHHGTFDPPPNLGVLQVRFMREEARHGVSRSRFGNALEPPLDHAVGTGLVFDSREARKEEESGALVEGFELVGEGVTLARLQIVRVLAIVVGREQDARGYDSVRDDGVPWAGEAVKSESGIDASCTCKACDLVMRFAQGAAHVPVGRAR